MVIYQIPKDYPAHLLAEISGGTVKGERLEFDCTEIEAQNALKAAFDGKKFMSVDAKAYTPDDADTEIIKGLLGNPGYDMAKLSFHKLDTANSIKDFDDDIFEKSYLDELARQVNEESRSILMYHDTKRVVGRKFRAEVVQRQFPNGEMGWQLIEYAWALKAADGGGSPLGELLDSGSLKSVSIGIMGTGRRYDDVRKAIIWFHIPGETETLNRETSFVYFGAQRWAQIAKAKNFTRVDPPKSNNKMEKIALSIGGEVKTFTAEPEIQKAFTTMEAAQKAAESERDTLKAELDSYREPICSNIINREKSLEVAEAARWDEKGLASLPITRIQAISDDLDTRHKAANPSLNGEGNEKALDKDGKEIVKDEKIDYLKTFS